MSATHGSIHLYATCTQWAHISSLLSPLGHSLFLVTVSLHFSFAAVPLSLFSVLL